MLRAVGVSLAAAIALVAADSQAAPPGTVSQRVAYGVDDRIEWSAMPAGALKQRIRNSTVALIPMKALQFDGASVAVIAPPLGAAQNVCSGERFVAEPSAAVCSAVLIDDDLVLTAAHCLPDAGGCPSERFVFDYLLDTCGTIAVPADAVYACRRRVPFGGDAGESEMAVVQLDRSAAAEGRQPVDLAQRDPRDGEPLVHASYGQGLPLKVDLDAHVALAPTDGSTFTAAVDAFGGASGSGVLLTDGKLAGILQEGRQDYVMRGGCRVARTVDEKDGAERVTLARVAVSALCTSGWPSARLCGGATAGAPAAGSDASMPRCGDPGASPDGGAPRSDAVDLRLRASGGGCSVAAPANRASTPLGLLGALVGLSVLRRLRRPSPRGRRRAVLLWGVLVAACSREQAVLAPANLAGAASPTSVVRAAPDVAAVVERTARGVVSLVVTRPVTTASGGVDGSREDGSGVVVRIGTGEGLVVTNEHVVRGAERVDAVGPGGRILRATVVASDEPTDLAVLRISGDLRGLEALDWAPDAPHRGEPVIVVGNALGKGLAASAGILSAAARSGLGHARYEDFLVTDARTPRGTSGGALVDASGRLLGIDTGIWVDAGVSFGIAVSARLAVPVVRALLDGQPVSRGHVGVEVEDLAPARAEELGYGSIDGALVSAIEPGSPAELSGLRIHDVVLSANGWAVQRRGNFRAALSIVPGGAAIPLVVVRDRSEIRLTLTLGSHDPPHP